MFSYKPRHRFELFWNYSEKWHVVGIWQDSQWDSNTTSGRIDLICKSRVEKADMEAFDDAGFIRCVCRAVYWLAMHDMHEWLRFAGTPLVDPHSEPDPD